MADTFDACGVFEIAEQIERNGAKFYRKAAEIFDDDGMSDTLRKLADWETEHERIFATMREQLSGSGRTSASPGREQLVNDPKAMAGLAVFGIRPEPRDELTGTESRDDVLRRAIEKEKESIAFYEGLKDFAADKAGRDRIEDIIKEEMGHIATLNKLLE
jgi:rubrerythrin